MRNILSPASQTPAVPLNLRGCYTIGDPHKSRRAKIIAWNEEQFVFLCFFTESIRIRFRRFHEKIKSAVRVNTGKTIGTQ